MIRLSSFDDAEAINLIYNQAVAAKCTAHTEHLLMDYTLQWLNNHPQEKYPVYIFELDHQVCGWLSFSPYREGRNAFAGTAEISFYIHNDWQRMNIGSSLVKHALCVSEDLKFDSLLAFIHSTNTGSINLLNKFGFTKWGEFPEIARFDEYRCNHIIMGKKPG